MAAGAAELQGVRQRSIKRERPPGGAKRWTALAFLGPAAILLGALIVYPTVDTIAQSFQSSIGREWVGLANFQEMASSPRIRTAIKNTFIWLLVAPVLATGIGLIFAVLTERVRYGTAIKVLLFMPMAISFLATGVIWRLVYEQDPRVGLVNAGVNAVSRTFDDSGSYPDAVPPPDSDLRKDGKALLAPGEVQAGDSVNIGLVGMTEPADAQPAAQPEAGEGQVAVTVWRDFSPDGGEPGRIDGSEVGLPGMPVQLLSANGEVVSEGVADAAGRVTLAAQGSGPFQVRIPESAFEQGFQGISWLGSSLVTPAVIVAFLWVHIGFAVVVIGAGLSALPRDVLEAARVDGANEFQVFRRVTLPLLGPVLGVVFVTLTINVLKLFDLVYVLPPPGTQDDANVIALEMWKSAFSARDYGLGAAVAVLLFILVIPIIVLNIRRFKRENN